MVGAERSEVAPSNPKDSRFKDPAWSESQYFDVMRQAYLITSHWAENLIEDVDGLEPETQQKARVLHQADRQRDRAVELGVHQS